VYSASEETGRQAISEGFSEIERIEEVLSTYDESSEISILNREKEISNPSDDLLANIRKSAYYGELSSGAFDITVQPILDLYKESFEVNKRPPTDDEVKNELEKVDYSEIEASDDRVSIGPGQKITLGGVAKGYAVDKVIELIKAKGIENALVNAGGDIRTIGKKAGSIEWTIALANPRDKKEYITIIRMSDKAVVTSGDYERYFDDDMKFHHIVNPLTGYSADELISVTIVAENAFDADAISTSVFVMGPEKGLELIEGLDNVEGLLITSEKEIIKSSGFD
jgi:thiamine biosynthesis lipoprotein